MDSYPPTNAGMSGKGLAATTHLDDVLSDDDSGEFDVFLLLLLRRSSVIADMMMSPLYELVGSFKLDNSVIDLVHSENSSKLNITSQRTASY
jgi:hypothetical protein